MKDFWRLLVVAPTAALVLLLVFLLLNRSTLEELAFLRNGQGGEAGLVDQRPYHTAQTLAALAVSGEEQAFANEALRLSDHEVDQAFAQALREAGLRQRVLSGEAAATSQRITQLRAMVHDDKARVDQLEAAAKISGIAPAGGDDLDIAKAQLGLDSDELTDATDDLARQSGDQRPRIQAELSAREDTLRRTGESAQKGLAAFAAQRHPTLLNRINAWFSQRNRVALLHQAEALAQTETKAFARQHAELERQSTAGPAAALTGPARVQSLRRMSAERVLMSILDDRLQTEQQLAAVYGRWQTQVWRQHRIVRYLILQSLVYVALIAFAASLAIVLARKAIHRTIREPRRAGTLQTILTLAIEGLALVGFLLILFGVPQQTPTIVGFATAGLTVAFQDFIVAFFGWFVLMGRNGIRVSDWVEINGVAGEVSEIGLFRTTLLETGNWTGRGHPTGRKVTLINSFAIRGQFFNFSTHGQWLWDELRLSVASGVVAYDVLQQMQSAVASEAAPDTSAAQAEWRVAAGSVALGRFSAAPTVDLRPAGSGVDIVVRFVTRATDRFDRRSRLYSTLITILRAQEIAANPAPAALPEGNPQSLS